jgi:hypothetical protein
MTKATTLTLTDERKEILTAALYSYLNESYSVDGNGDEVARQMLAEISSE